MRDLVLLVIREFDNSNNDDDLLASSDDGKSSMLEMGNTYVSPIIFSVKRDVDVRLTTLTAYN